ncbi:PTS transporter subunit EIIC [Aerococcaceae bacterium DSM 111021]|nr:PTS transporter subunit EIIC [Aerococcaceae bacterium DSM 111021]
MTNVKGDTQGGILNKVLDALKNIFAPNLIALSAAGVLQGFTILLHTFGVIQEGNAEYIILETISGAVFYFLPILLAYSAAKVFNTNQVLAACVAMFMLHPTITQTFSEGYVLADFFGIPLPYGNYPSSVIPIIIIVFIQQYIERFFNKIIPSTVRGVFAPMLILVTTVVLGISVLGPIGTFLGDGLLAIIMFLNVQAKWLVPALLGGFGLFVVMAGAHYSLFPVVTQTLAAEGFDSFLTPGLLASNLALAGAALAVMIKSNNSSYKQYSVTSVVTAALGVSQPALYGIAIPYKRVMMASIIGGLAGGFYAGIVEFYSYAFVNPGIAALPAFISPDGTFGNLINGIIVMTISFGVSFLIVLFGKFEDMPEAEIAEIVGEEEK